jgi:hypothetical protein
MFIDVPMVTLATRRGQTSSETEIGGQKLEKTGDKKTGGNGGQTERSRLFEQMEMGEARVPSATRFTVLF